MKLMTRLMASAALTVRPARAWDGATPLVATVDTLDDVPETLRAYYTERNGKFELQVSGAASSAEVDALRQSLSKEKALHKTLQDRVKLLGEHRIEDIPAMLDRIPELEAHQGTVDEEKVNAIVEARIKARMGPVERDLKAAQTQLTEKDQTIGEFQAKERTRKIHDKVREDAVKAKLLPEAIEDALLLADRVFDFDEATDRVVTKDNVGVTPGIEPGAWLTDIQKTRPHWWGPSQGGGAGGSGRNVGGDSNANPFMAESWNLTAQGALVQSDRPKAEQLARLAGTTIGGQMPPPRK